MHPECLLRKTLAGLILVMATASSDSHAALVIYYPLNETSGNVAVDAALLGGIQSATGTTGASNWQSGGIIGGALQFSPTAQADVDEALIYDAPTTVDAIIGAHPFTISLWVKTTAAPAWTQAATFLGNRTQAAQYYAVGMSPTTNLPQLVARNTTAVNTAGPGTVNDDQWHHIAAVFSATNSRSLYVDGRWVGTSSTNVTHPVTNRFAVGALSRSNPTDSFIGTLDEIGLFDSAATEAEVALLNAFPRFDPVALDDSDYAAALNVYNTQSGTVTTGTWTWAFASSLVGPVGSTGIDGGSPYVVLDSFGNGLVAIPEPGSAGLAAAVLGLLALRRRRPKSPK
jgi:MYXO-CTERM domain-containing protein